MPSESKIPAQMEKPNHYSYLKEFRVEQCPLFLQHKCTQHRPYTCFNWHFMNQRRRRPVRKRDGTFNYSADDYCTQYDETTGVCTKGDECQYLHRTAGDTERRYHLRYYKTCMCVHDTDSRGFCTKNGPHCAFAHGNHDLRPPVYDINEQKVTENDEDENIDLDGPNVLDKEKNLMNEDPKWQDTNYVLSNYKTDQCQRPPRLCRQGYACPQYHNSRDKRRNPRKYKYRSTPCPSVKHGDEWGEPSNCESGDSCAYCHTRTEQQFHPEIYKSTKCNDVQQAGYCPRGVFCAFAHIDQEMIIARESAAGLDSSTDLADILSNALPSIGNECIRSPNGSGDLSECTSSIGSPNKAPGAHLSRSEFNVQQFQIAHEDTIQALLNSFDSQSLLPNVEPQRRHSSIFGPVVSNGNSNSSYMNHFSSYQPTTNMNGNLDDLVMEDNLNFSVDQENESPILNNPLSSSLQASDILGSSAPVNIPLTRHNSIGHFSPTISSPLKHMQNNMIQKSRYNQQDGLGHLNIVTGNNYGSTGLFGIGSPGTANTFPISPSNSNEVQRLQEELLNCRSKLVSWESERMSQVRCTYEAWQRETEDLNTKLKIAEQQRDEAINQAKSLQQEVDLLQGSPYLHGLRRVSEIRNLSLSVLKSLQSQMRNDLEEIEKVLYLQTATKCMLCEEQNRSVTLGPCNHFVLCNQCVDTIKDCPYCSTPILSHTNTSTAQA
ncbi:RING finger protein unkempt isoform X3 [Sipha flava]|uniref:RING finger protein n=1 Tax=Sipha flava TaxID=143950 RepID=A0A2S2QJF2_9HEMI|nr:RING finger protein unkempt isoform X3 [Sipha flava]